MPEEDYMTTIKVMSSTRDRLKSVFRKNETYDEGLKRLIDYYLNN